MMFTNEELTTSDWRLGPAGTGQEDYRFTCDLRFDIRVGLLAESWDLVEPGHVIFKIRQGIHFGLNPDSEASRLVGGRELIAEDVAYSITRIMTNPGTYINLNTPELFKDSLEITTPDKYTVDVKVTPEAFMYVMTLFFDLVYVDYPAEVIEKYGDMADWKNSVGTGPFFLTDYTPGSLMSLKRNPNYWMTDPTGPGKGNQLPYVDGVKVLIIPDASTRNSALRTGLIDQQMAVIRDEAKNVLQTTPELEYVKYAPMMGWGAMLRIDRPELATSDIRVRRALSIAIDFNKISETMFDGDADIKTYPESPIKGYEALFVALDDPDCPESVKELYDYNPEKAKQLLTEAGYPDGFTAHILVQNRPDYVDQLAIFKDMWSEIGVDLEIETLERGAFVTRRGKQLYDEMIYSNICSTGAWMRFMSFYGRTGYNLSLIDDPLADEAFTKITEAFNAFDEAKAMRVYREFSKYAAEQAWVIPFPWGYVYNLWWPWVENYHGVVGPGYWNENYWARYAWIDQDLKAEMGY